MRWMARLLVPTILTVVSPLAHAEEWPKWLGPRGDSISHEAISQSWPAAGPAKVWEQKVGFGFSSPIGFDGKVYLFTQTGDQDTLHAFDAATGKPLWSVAYACTVSADQSQAKNPESIFPLPLATPRSITGISTPTAAGVISSAGRSKTALKSGTPGFSKSSTKRSSHGTRRPARWSRKSSSTSRAARAAQPPSRSTKHPAKLPGRARRPTSAGTPRR